MAKIPLVIDCDPGIDDAIALSMLLGHPKIDLLAITAVAGNVPLVYTSQNALNLVGALGFDTPVAAGAAQPLFRDQVTAEYVHGKSGFGSVELPKSKSSFSPLSADELIVKIAEEQKGELVLAAIGPLTNIAILFIKYPRVKKLIKNLVIMGGAIDGGNITEAAEFNIFVDPEAAQIVFRSGIPILMAGLEAGDSSALTDKDIEDIGAAGSEKAKLMESFLLSAKTLSKRKFNIKKLSMYDPAAVMYLLNPEAMSLKDAHIDVEIWGEYTYGKTVVDYKRTPNAKVVLSLLHDALKDELVAAAKRG